MKDKQVEKQVKKNSRNWKVAVGFILTLFSFSIILGIVHFYAPNHSPLGDGDETPEPNSEDTEQMSMLTFFLGVVVIAVILMIVGIYMSYQNPEKKETTKKIKK